MEFFSSIKLSKMMVKFSPYYCNLRHSHLLKLPELDDGIFPSIALEARVISFAEAPGVG